MAPPPRGMNATERAAWTWLRAQGHDDLTFQRRGTPDFVAGNGRGWEVKLARQRVVVIYPAQLATLRERARTTSVLLWGPGGTAPLAEIPATRLQRLPLEWGRYRLVGPAAVLATARLPDELHRLVRIAAAEEGRSAHAWMLQAVRAAIAEQARSPGNEALAAALDGQPP